MSPSPLNLKFYWNKREENEGEKEGYAQDLKSGRLQVNLETAESKMRERKKRRRKKREMG